MKKKKIIILGGRKKSTNIVYNYLSDYFLIEKVILEAPVSKKKILKRRIKKLGFFKVLGQILFILVIPNFLKRLSNSRIQELYYQYNLKDSSIPEENIFNVSSVNSPNTLSLLKINSADFIIVNGTRIISNKVISEITIPLINIHVGITPLYRGVHGAYWSLVRNDESNCGVTIHKIDKGIDTGNILAQANIKINSNDNFYTYPLLQLGTALPILKNLLYRKTKLKDLPPPKGASILWYHPTLFTYIYFRLAKGIK